MKKTLLKKIGLWVGAIVLSSEASFAVISSEKKIMDEARQAYSSAKYEKAISLYNQIPQTSDYWTLAIEEKAWAYLQKGENNKALSQITTLTSDFLAPQIGPEPYFLKGLIDYRLCNIKGIFQDFEMFRKRFKNRSEQLEKLKDTTENIASAKAIETLKAKRAQLNDLKADDFGQNIQFLPRFFYRDSTIKAAVETQSDRRISMRLAQLAERESKEIEAVLQKMHLLESQVVQQVFAYNKEMQKKSEAQFSNEDKNSLVFPYRGQNDIWLDEIDSFEAATSDCPVDPLKGATL
ncbi:MAG: hypothetical protein RJB66_1419 [Pseudomonadota bacterium]|jgi:hypothetical protein